MRRSRACWISGSEADKPSPEPSWTPSAPTGSGCQAPKAAADPCLAGRWAADLLDLFFLARGRERGTAPLYRRDDAGYGSFGKLRHKAERWEPLSFACYSATDMEIDGTLKPVPVDLDVLGDVLEGDPLEGGGILDLDTGEVFPESVIELEP